MPKALEIWEGYEEGLKAIEKVKIQNAKLTARLKLLSTPTWIRQEKHRVFICPNPKCDGKLHVVGTFQPHATGLALVCDTCGELYRGQ